jgi:hypothetical protein
MLPELFGLRFQTSSAVLPLIDSAAGNPPLQKLRVLIVQQRLRRFEIGLLMHLP